MPPLLKSTKPSITAISTKNSLVLTFAGQWLTLDLAPMEIQLSNFRSTLARNVALKAEFSEGFDVDIAGAWLIAQFFDTAKQVGCHIETDLPPLISHHAGKYVEIPESTPTNIWTDCLEYIGLQAIDFAQSTQSILNFLGLVIVTFIDGLKKRVGLRWVSIVHHIHVVGLQAFPIIALISFLIGSVLAYQGVNQLSRFGASSFTVDFLAISLLREISVLLTSIVVAGRSGSAFTAQIGTMALNQEIDAIRMLGLNPLHILVIPRVLALLIALPILVLISILMGAIGGMIIVHIAIDMPFVQFWQLFQLSATTTTFWVGMCKAPLFAAIIAIIGCFRGMQVKGSAESVGLMTTQSVVESIFMIIVCDGFISIFFSALDI